MIYKKELLEEYSKTKLDSTVKTTEEDEKFAVPSNDGILCSIIIPVYGNENFTRAAIDDLLRLPSCYEIIIVDNFTISSLRSDTNALTTYDVFIDAFDKRTENQAKLEYIGCPKNLGFGRGNNKGYKHASGEYILFLNSDIRVQDRHEDWPSIMLEWAERGFLVGTQGGLLDKGFNFVKEGTGLEQTDHWYVSGWCLCGSKENFDKLILDYYAHDETDEIMEGKAWGPWNEKFFAYFEDGDLTWRARDLGIEFKEVTVPVHHFGRMTGRKLNISHLYKKSQRIFKKIWKDKR